MTLLVSRRRVAGAVSAALLAGWGTAWVTRDDTAPLPVSSASVPSASVPSASVPSAGPSTTASPSAASPSRAAVPPIVVNAVDPQPPSLLEIDRIGVRMPVVPVSTDAAGAMALPPTPDEAGWYRFGSTPDSGQGATVLAGHLDTREDGVGPLAGLVRLQPGDPVDVTVGTTVHHYRVDSVHRIAKAGLDLSAIFDLGGAPRLHLVTCGGRYDRTHGGYQDNVVVVARPAP